jgi:RND family efflux transporter MFP subunit
MRQLTLALIIAFSVLACGGGASKIDELRKELNTKKEDLSKLKDAIDKLEKEISALDTGKKEDLGIAVMVDTISSSVFKNPFTFQGLVSSDMNVTISPEVPSTITKIHVKEGQSVYKGQILASLDGRQASAQIAELENSLKLAKTNFEKQERLWKQNIGSEMQYLQAKSNYEGLTKTLLSAQVQLGKFSLRSPINGTVDEIMANEGQMVGSIGGPSGVMRVVNLSDIEIKANVSERYLGNLKKGQEIEVYYPSLDLRVKEKIAAVGNVIDVNNRTFMVTVKPSHEVGTLKPNLLAMITGSDFVKENSISVPTKLIRNDGNGDYVLCVNKESKVEKVIVEIERQFSARSIIKGGLSEGDLLIIEGYNSVIAGDRVKLVSEIN